MVKQGNIIFVDFNPTVGREQSGHRPGVVVSNNAFIKNTTGLALVLPITSTMRTNFPLHVSLDERTIVQGQIMCEQIKTIDTRMRSIKIVESIPDDLLQKILKIIHLQF